MISLLVNTVLGTLVLLGQKEKANKLFGFMVLGIVIWTIGILGIALFTEAPYVNADLALYASRLTFLGTFFIMGGFFILSYYFPSPILQDRFSRIAQYIIWITIIGLAIASIFSEFLVEDLYITETGYQNKYGLFYQPYFLFIFLALIVGGLARYFYRYYKAEGLEKTQLSYFFLGSLLSIIFGGITNLVIPQFTGSSHLSNIGPFTTVFLVMLTSVAIVKYRLLNIKVIATELFSFFLILTLFVRFLLSQNIVEWIANGAILAGSIVFSILLIRSVLREVRAREEIERLAKNLEFANKELKRLDEAKSEFISIASHQLRTPLSIIKGYISMIREGSYGAISENTRKTLNKIYLSNERLVKLVADLLDLSRMESGKLQYEFAEFNIVDVVDSTIDEFKIPTSDRGIALIWKKPEETLAVWGDSWKLRQVIFNLIDNGLKYTEKGAVAVSLKKANNTVTLAVKDTGIGMTPEIAHGLFQKFARGKDSSRVNAQGLGLGLFIAKKIIDDHQGKLWAESEGEGKGSVFYIELPSAESVRQKKEFQSFVGNL